MAWLAIDRECKEWIFSNKPQRLSSKGEWIDEVFEDYIRFITDIELPKGTIKKLIGRDLTWQDEPVELKEE